MHAWGEFATLEPELSAHGAALLYEVGVGLAYLSTVRPDGGPRLHPMCPILHKDGLFAFIVPSPKLGDLHRDGRYAMHSFPRPDDEDAFYLTGLASPVGDAEVRASIASQFVDERAQHHVPAPADHDVCFEFFLASALLTRTDGHGDVAPRHTVWRGAARRGAAPWSQAAGS